MSLPEKSQTYGPFKEFASPAYMSKLCGVELLELDRICTHGMVRFAIQRTALRIEVQGPLPIAENEAKSRPAVKPPPFRSAKGRQGTGCKKCTWAKSPPTQSRLSSCRSRPRSPRCCAICAWTTCTACWSVLPLCELRLLGVVGKLGRWASTPTLSPLSEGLPRSPRATW